MDKEKSDFLDVTCILFLFYNDQIIRTYIFVFISIPIPIPIRPQFVIFSYTYLPLHHPPTTTIVPASTDDMIDTANPPSRFLNRNGQNSPNARSEAPIRITRHTNDAALAVVEEHRKGFDELAGFKRWGKERCQGGLNQRFFEDGLRYGDGSG